MIATDKRKTNLNDYITRWISIRRHYNLVHLALKHINKEVIEEHVKSEVRLFQAFHSATGSGEDIEKKIKKVINKRLQDIPKDAKLTYNRIRQNTLILHFAIFESFWKDILRAILFYDPKLLVLGKDKDISLGMLISKGYEVVINHEIEKVIYSLDRKPFSKIYDYFKKKLDIKHKIIKDDLKKIEEYKRLRNDILHKDPDKLISEDQVNKAANSCLSMAVYIHAPAMAKYPDVFTDNETKK